MPPQKQQTREEFIRSLFLMEPADNIHLASRDRLIAGMDKVIDAIKLSYGPTGSNCIVEVDLYPFHRTTNDGKLIAEAIKLADPVENIGANIAKETADKSDKISGDGRKTSMILLSAILHEGLKVDAPPMDIKRSLDECLPIILDGIDNQTKKINPKDIGSIAKIASESEELGSLFQEIYKKIGRDGVVDIDNSNLPETFYDITEGVKLIGCGYQYPYMGNEDKGRQAVYKYPKILICKEKINVMNSEKVFESLMSKGCNELVIFCDEIDLAVSQGLAKAHFADKFRTLVIKAPTLWKDWLFEDFAKITGATIVDPGQGTSLKNFRLEWLGTCDKIITSKDETVVLGIQDISEHLKVLEEENTDASRLRLSRLKTKTATLKLGANSESELSYIHGKALDARNASYLALQGGVVPGGGQALSTAATSLGYTLGGKILKSALDAPLFQILENMGIKKDDNVFQVVDKFADILDPAIVVKNSITNAISVAGTVLTSKLVITKPK